MGNLPSWLNPFDVFIVFILLGGIALGFIRGLVRMVMNLLVLYVAMVLAITFYASIGRWVAFVSAGFLPRNTTQAIAFLLILVLTTVIINFILYRTYKDTELPGIRQIDQLGGMIGGFVLVSTWIGLGIVALAFVLTATDVAGSSLRENMILYFQTSYLIPTFYKLLPIVLATLRPWMPKGLPPEILLFKIS